MRRSYLEYKKYLQVKEGVGFQWTQDLVGGLQDILKAFTRGRRAAAINEYFDKVFEYGKLRGTEIGENIGPKLKENINKDTDFKYEQLILEIEWSKTAIANIRKYIFDAIKNVVGEVTANHIRESKIEIPTFLKLVSEESNLATIDKNKNIARNNTSTSIPGVKPNYTYTQSGTGNSQYGQPHSNPNNQLPPSTSGNSTNQAVDADYEIIDDKVPPKDNVPPTTQPNDKDKSEKSFEDMTEPERIKLLSFLDQRIQDFIEMNSPMTNKILKIWSEFLFIKAQKTENVEKNESLFLLNENTNIPLESYKKLLEQTGKIITSHGGNNQSPVLYDILAYTLSFIGSEGYFDFYKPTANQITDKEVKRFAAAMIPGRSLSHTLILVVSALTSLEVSLEYVKDKIRRKNRTGDKSIVRKEEYRNILTISNSLSKQSNFINFETVTYKSLRRQFNKYFLALGVNSGKRLYEEYKENLAEIYKILFFELPNKTDVAIKDNEKFFTYTNTKEETSIKGTSSWDNMIVDSGDVNKIEKILDSYFGLLLDGDKTEYNTINNEIGSIKINFKNTVYPVETGVHSRLCGSHRTSMIIRVFPSAG